MKELTIICDNCGRKYTYKIQAGDRYPEPTMTIFKKEYCRQCCKKMVELLKAILTPKYN